MCGTLCRSNHANSGNDGGADGNHLALAFNRAFPAARGLVAGLALARARATQTGYPTACASPGRIRDLRGIYLRRLTGDEQAAYDLCQENFLRAWQQFEKIHHYEQPGAWLFRVATNLALNAIERRATALGHVIPLREDIQPATEDPVGRIASLELIHQTLLRLPARERAVLVLREVESFSMDEIARALDVSASSVRMLLSRARAHFRQRYDHGDSEEARA